MRGFCEDKLQELKKQKPRIKAGFFSLRAGSPDSKGENSHVNIDRPEQR